MSAVNRSHRRLLLPFAALLALILWVGLASRPQPPATTTAGVAAARDLSRDEAAGGHTLARHVARTDPELARRLADEPGISTASTFHDRRTAEEVVAAALARHRERIESWSRNGNGNLALDVAMSGAAIGRTMSRSGSVRESRRARVVLRRSGRSWFVLTAYPLEER